MREVRLLRTTWLGALVWFLSMSQGFSQIADFRLQTAKDVGGAARGYAVAGVGDVDQDGFDDLLVGVYLKDSEIVSRGGGRAYVISGRTNAIVHELQAPRKSSSLSFGRAVGAAGDIDQDGYADVIVGAPAEAGTGRAYLFSGKDGSLLFELRSTEEQAGGDFGWSVARAGDVDNDGYSDIVIGAPREAAGSAYIFSGRDGSALQRLASPQAVANGEFGFSVAGIGDLNGDGHAEIAIGARREEAEDVRQAGRAYIFNGKDGRVLFSLQSPSAVTDGSFGISVATAHDIDHDNIDDLIIGASGEQEGRAYIFSGKDGSTLLQLRAPRGAASREFGAEVAGPGDVNQDGYADVAAAASNGTHVFSGRDGSHLMELPSPDSQGRAALSLASAGDVNQDGIPDLVVASGMTGGSGFGYFFSSATPDIATAPSSFSFGNIAVGQSSGVQNLNISNVGSAVLTVNNVSLTGANPGEFTLTPVSPLPFTLNPGQSKIVQVQYTPTTAGAHSASLTINSDDPDENPVNVSLSGTGLSPFIAASKTDALVIDNNSDGNVDPGDTVEYTVVINNSGTGSAFDVEYDSNVDVNTTLTVGSVSTTNGVVTSGNASGNTSVGVFIGTIPASGNVTVKYRITVNAAIPSGITQIACQGTVSGSNFSDVLTDDPASGGSTDPTLTDIDVSPVISASKSDALVIDHDSDGKADPGDTIEYTVVVTNTGSQDASSVVFTSAAGTNSKLVNGSVTTTAGSITSGNTSGDSNVSVSVLFLNAVTGTFTVKFRVTVDNPFPVGVTEIQCQGSVSGNNFSTVNTDDPAVGGGADPTVTQIFAAPIITATKVDNNVNDVDSDGLVDPGDKVRYTVVVTNSGDQDAVNLSFTSNLDPNTALVIGSVSASAGTVVTGNTAGDNSVAVDIATLLASGGNVTITFDVIVNNPFPGAVSQIACQGQVSGGNFSQVVTDDPNTGTPSDATATPIDAETVMSATKTAAIQVDNDSDGQADPGDVIRYTVVIQNDGDQEANGVLFASNVDANSALTVGSVTSSQGTISSGNSGGDTSVGVSLGTITGGGGSVTITFDVTIDNPFQAGANQISCQGQVSGSNFSSFNTDDPGTGTSGDPTVTPVQAAPQISATKQDALVIDNDSDGKADPGDTVEYTVVITNSGNQATLNVNFLSAVDPNSDLVVGSVTTTLGTINSGNNAGDTSVNLDTGVMPGGNATVTIKFRVIVDNPFPVGVIQIACQGFISGTDFANSNTDDPDTEPSGDATITEIDASTGLTATKQDVILVDNDGDGQADPGDKLRYNVVITNFGSLNASGASFFTTVDPNTNLVVGSVTTTQGTITKGNNSGDTFVNVNTGTISGGGTTVTITFDVTIKLPFPSGVSQVSCQGLVSGTNFANVNTDDPNTPAADDATVTPIDLTPALTITKTDAMVLDNDSDGNVDPGDKIRYTVTITNQGVQSATIATYSSNVDGNSTLVVGSVTTTQGSVTSGNSAGNTSVSINLGTINGGITTATITYDVMVNKPFPANVTQIACQGQLSGSNFPTKNTDDPDTGAPGDATTTPVTSATNVSATKNDGLIIDNDSDGKADPGDRVRYTVVITNTGDQNAAGVLYSSSVDPNSGLVVGSVTTTQGTITSGNVGSQTAVGVTVGTINGTGGTVTITYDVTVVNPFPAGFNQISCQGQVTGTNFSNKVTDDPSTGTANDATVTPIDSAPSVAATKTDALLIDGNSNGLANPGETIKYTVVISNTGNKNAGSVLFTSNVDPNSSLVVGSVTSTQGTITTGNNVGNTSVGVSLGTLAANSSVTVMYNVTINNPFPAGVTEIASQGSVASPDFPTLNTDDPDTPAGNDPTKTPVISAPEVSATKTDAIQTDNDSDGLVDPGDVVKYTVVISNTGTQGASDVVYNSNVGVNTTLVVGSVTTTQGTVTSGNSAGNTSIAVGVGTLPAGSSVTVTYNVQVDLPFPVGVTQISCQGTVSGSNFSSASTDDPDTGAPIDATITPIDVAPIIAASKTDALVVDNDSDGKADPGDTVEYTVVINNGGSLNASDVVYSSGVDANAALVVGSVTTTLGSVTSGNNAGETSVGVNVGTLNGGGGSLTIKYRVTVNSPFPVGVSQIACQGLVSGSNFNNLNTDDPDTGAPSDPTVTPIDAASVLSATKTDAVFVDNDSDGKADPGDKVKYTVVITNNGSQAATNVTYTSGVDPNSTLVVGSVTSTLGTVNSGNNAGQSTVVVSVGTVPALGGTVTITYQVTVANPFPAGATQLSCQGLVSGGNFPNLNTDDPDTPTGGDATVTPVDAGPVITALKTDALLVDGDSDGKADPGETVKYTVVISNTGTQAASGVNFNSGVDANSDLVVGSVTTTQGAVTSGNTVGETSVGVNIGTLAVGANVTITFNVTIDNPFPLGTAQIACQGTVSGTNFSNVSTDDPDTATPNDPTITPIDAESLISANKTDALLVDANSDGLANPGDIVKYTVVITNNGSQAGTGVVYASNVDINSTLVVGSVTTTQGTVTTGNTAGHTSVSVNVGTLASGGTTVTITYNVTIKSPFPANATQISSQGTVSGSNFANLSTNDPDTPALNDATITAVTAAPVLAATKTDAIFTDTDSDGKADPGDVVKYTVVLTNSGNKNAGAVVFTSNVDPNSALVVGSVTTTKGTVTAGNTAGNTSVGVNVGAINGNGATVTITFLVTVANPFPIGVAQISCQGQISGSNFANKQTDDPDTATPDDPTITPIDASAIFSATKSDALFTDNDTDGKADPGDAIKYTVVISNSGSQNASGVTYSSNVDPNTTLLVGSVTTTKGTVTGGNSAGNTSVGVNIGAINGGTSVTITYIVTVKTPFTGGNGQVSCQGTVAGTGFANLLTDDPDTPAPSDPTVTIIDVSPLIIATSVDALSDDVNSNGFAEPGDRITYTVVITNNGALGANGVNFTSNVDANTALVQGSVTTTAGTVSSGNIAGQTSVGVNVGVLNANGGTATITFEVLITGTSSFNSVSCQGSVAGTNFTKVLTDDPDTATPNDPTVTLICTNTDLIGVDNDQSVFVRIDLAAATLNLTHLGSFPNNVRLEDAALDVSAGLVYVTVDTSIFGQLRVATREDVLTQNPVPLTTIGFLPNDQYEGLAVHPVTGDLYAIDGDADRLALVNKTTAAVTYIGSPSSLLSLVEAMCFRFENGNPVLYGIGSDAITSRTMTIDITTGVPTLVHPSNAISLPDIEAMACDPCPAIFGANRAIAFNTSGGATFVNVDLTTGLGTTLTINGMNQRDIEGLFFNATSISVPPPPPPPTNSWEQLIVADKVVNFNGFTTIEGDVHSNFDFGSTAGNPSVMTGNLTVKRDLPLANANTINGNVTAGGIATINAGATVTGTVTSSATVAVIPVDVLGFGPFEGNDMLLTKGSTATLAPGTYNVVRCSTNAQITFSSGTYNLNRLVMDASSRLRLDLAGGPVIINVDNRLLFRKDMEVQIISVTGTSKDIFINFDGTDKLLMAKNARVQGNILAPTSRVKITAGAGFLGAIRARRVDINNGASLRHHDIPGGIPKGVDTESPAAAAEIPADYVLEQNYPNPFNPSTKISFAIPVAGQARLQIYDLTGKRIQTLVNNQLEAGYHEFNWNGRNRSGEPAAAGTYVYRLIVERDNGEPNLVLTKKMTLVK